MDEKFAALLEALQAQTSAMRELTGAVQALADSNMELVALVADEGAGADEYGEHLQSCYLDGTPVE